MVDRPATVDGERGTATVVSFARVLPYSLNDRRSTRESRRASRFPSFAQHALTLRPHVFRKLHPAPKALGHEKSFFSNALAREAHGNGASARKALLTGVSGDFVLSFLASTRSWSLRSTNKMKKNVLTFASDMLKRFMMINVVGKREEMAVDCRLTWQVSPARDVEP